MTKKEASTRRSRKKTRDDYRLSDDDVYLFREGTHYRLWDVLGAHPGSDGGKPGVSFSVWAPAARIASVVDTVMEGVNGTPALVSAYSWALCSTDPGR